ncbi:MAG: DEAD/DEAH box helicase [Candidatus Paceibacterota bacterium]
MTDWTPLSPRSWQADAYAKWEAAHFSATIEAGTGSGKTYLGLMVRHQFPTKKLLVVVPTIHLMYQWDKEFKGAFEGLSIGMVGEGFHNFEEDITIAVVNSIREEDLKVFEIVILDEAHRYMSIVNRLFLERHKFPILMALTATMEREDGLHKSFLANYPCVYKISQKDCIDAGWLCKYSVVNLPCPLLPAEQEAYDSAHGFVRANWHRYQTMAGVMAGMRQGEGTAFNLMKAISTRRSVLLNSATKIVYTANLIVKEPNVKTIVFGEYKNAAEKLYKILQKYNIPCAIYHSGMGMKKRQDMLEQFKDDKFKVMISVKALDEGLNVPAVERAIIMGGSKVERQMTQRLGRVLRGQENKKALVIQLYIPDTKDEDWTKARTKPFEGAAEKIVWAKSSVLPEMI